MNKREEDPGVAVLCRRFEPDCTPVAKTKRNHSEVHVKKTNRLEWVREESNKKKRNSPSVLVLPNPFIFPFGN